MRLFYMLLLLFISTIFAFSGVTYFWWTTPMNAAPKNIMLDIKQGATLSQISYQLSKENIIRWPLFFSMYGRLYDKKNSLKAGTYEFNGTELPKEIFNKIEKGIIKTVSFSIPEGYNIVDISYKLSEIFPKTSQQIWLDAFKNPENRKMLPLNAVSLEGYLFPSTYSMSPNATVEEVISAMLHEFEKNFTNEMKERARQIGLSDYNVVVLASIIEKETGRADERAKISAVFHNRLRKGMRLQTDPTVIYGILEAFDGNLRKKDLLTPTPYNTYIISGLPPGPIANPGRAALMAALYPAPVDYLYFVARGDGSSEYSSTLQEHNNAVYRYQVAPVRANREK